MGSVIDFATRKRSHAPAAKAPQAPARARKEVTCAHCGEHHPVVLFPGGEGRCVTAFFDGEYWFCRNRGCRRAWLHEP